MTLNVMFGDMAHTLLGLLTWPFFCHLLYNCEQLLHYTSTLHSRVVSPITIQFWP
jgi:hypothetical protein